VLTVYAQTLKKTLRTLRKTFANSAVKFYVQKEEKNALCSKFIFKDFQKKIRLNPRSIITCSKK